MIEIWQPIFGFEGCEASNLGRVRTFWRRRGKGRGKGVIYVLSDLSSILNTHEDKDGYLKVNLRSVQRSVHSLVLTAFFGPCPVGLQGCHNDGNNKNNMLINLRWDTATSNVQDTVRHGTHDGFKRKGEKNACAKLTNDQARAVKLAIIAGQSGSKIARAFGVSPQLVCDIKMGRLWKHLEL